MPIAVVVIIRFVHALAAIGVWVGLSFAPSLLDYVHGMANGQAWELGELAKQFVRVSAPVVIGGLAFVGLEFMFGQMRMQRARSLRYPHEPWMWRPQWAEKRIRLSNRTAIIFSAVAFSLYFFVILPLCLWMASIKLATGIYWFVGIFGLILLAFARLQWLNRRWGSSELAISTLPGVIGGPFAGIVTLSEAFPEGTPFRVTLRCMLHRHSTSRRSGMSRSSTTVLWLAQKIVSRSIAADRPATTALPCYFAIPYDSSPTGEKDLPVKTGFFGSTRTVRQIIRWEISVAPKDETDVRRVSFEVPVYKTSQSSPSYQEDETIDRRFLETVDAETILSRIGYRRDETAAGERHEFSLFSWGPFLGLLAFTLAAAAGTIAIFTYVSFPVSGFAGLIPGALAIFSGVALVEMLTWRATIAIRPEGIAVTAGPVWSRQTFEYPRGALVPLDCAEQNRRENDSTWCVRLLPAGAPPCPLVKHLDGKQQATAVRDWLAKRMKDGVSPRIGAAA